MPDPHAPVHPAPSGGARLPLVDRRPGQRAVQITAITALAGVVAALVGLALVARPLRTPTQDCGTALTFLVSGGVNEYVDPSNPPEGITAADAEDNNADPCQERAGDRALPALLLVVGGTAIGVGALIAEWSLRYRMRRRAHRLHRAGPPTAGAG